MGVTLPKESSPQMKRMVVAVAEIRDDDDLASLRRHLPNAVLLELPRGPGDLQASASQVARAMAEAEERMLSCVQPDGLLLPPRQQRILALIAEGRTNKDIGRILGLSPFTVRNHISLLFRLLKVRTRAQAALVACQLTSEDQAFTPT